MNVLIAKPSGALNSGLDVLEIVVDHPDGISVTSIAAAVGGDKGNVHRILRSLTERGYVEQDEQTKLFTASGGLFTLAGTLLRRQHLAVTARPFMRALSDELQAPIHLAKRIKHGGVYIAREGSASGGVTVETEIGAQPIIYASATGKALFAWASAEELDQVIPSTLVPFTPFTHTEASQVAADLARVQEYGFAIDEQELTIGVSCVAAPIFDYRGEVIGSIGLSSPVLDADEDALHRRGLRIAAMASQITQHMGGHLPEPKPRLTATGD